MDPALKSIIDRVIIPALLRKYDREQAGLPNPDPPGRPPIVAGVYLLREGDVLKIGHSADVLIRVRHYHHVQRLALIACDSVVAARTLERALCRQFRQHLARGREYFHFTQAIVDRFTTDPRFQAFSPSRSARPLR